MNPLLNVDAALENILATVRLLPAETITLAEAHNRVIAADIVSPIDLPPFDNSAMDGYALYCEDSEGASRDKPATLPVVMDILAGSAPDGQLKRGQAARIMTGAPLPAGADAVIPVEDTDDDWVKGGSAAAPEQVRLFRQSAQWREHSARGRKHRRRRQGDGRGHGDRSR